MTAGLVAESVGALAEACAVLDLPGGIAVIALTVVTQLRLSVSGGILPTVKVPSATTVTRRETRAPALVQSGDCLLVTSLAIAGGPCVRQSKCPAAPPQRREDRPGIPRGGQP
jgi:hypothetical protein